MHDLIGESVKIYCTENDIKIVKEGQQILSLYNLKRGLGGVVVEFSLPTSEAAGSNLGPGASG